MKEHWLKLKEWWNGLATREKQGVQLGGTLLSIFIVYQFMLMPYLDHVSVMRSRIQSEQKLVAWMQAADTKIQKMEGVAHKNKAKSLSPVVMLSLLQKQISQAGLDLQVKQLKQVSNEAIEMQFQKVAFDKFIELIIITLKSQPITISQLSVTSVSPGYVNADVILNLS